MPKKKKVEIEETEQSEVEEKVKEESFDETQDKPTEGDFSAGASGKFDEEALSAEPAGKTDDDVVIEKPEEKKVDFLDDDVDKKNEEPEEVRTTPEEELTPESSSPMSPVSDDFDFSPPKKEAGGKKLMWIIIIVLLFAAGIGGGMYIFKNGIPGVAVATPSPEPTVEATPTPMPELDRSELNIQVQNGSGVPGTAKTAQEFLEELGYKVGGAKNAANYDYTEAEISLKEDKMGYKDQLIKDLSGKYSVNSNVTTLDEDSDFDAIIIIGEESEGGE